MEKIILIIEEILYLQNLFTWLASSCILTKYHAVLFIYYKDKIVCFQGKNKIYMGIIYGATPFKGLWTL